MKNVLIIILLIFSVVFFKCSSNKEDKPQKINETSINPWQNFEYGSISLSYPSSWQIFQDSVHNKINLYKKNQNDTSLFEYDISMTLSPKYYLGKQASFDEYIKKQIEQMKELYAISIQSIEERPVNSKKSYHYTGEYLSDVGRHETVHLYFTEGSYEDLIIFSTGDNSSSREADEIIQTIKIK